MKPREGVLAFLRRGDGQPLYTLVESTAGYHLRCHGVCDRTTSHGLDESVCFPDPAADPGLLPVIISGTMISVVLALGGHLVLHASAVDIGGVALAFVGQSGMGKSTLATIMCVAGARLITDDVLRVEPASPPVCG